MKSISKKFAIRRNLDSLLAGLVGFLIFCVFTNHSGVGISPDSVVYLSASRNWLSGKGFFQFDHVPMVDFPVLYPIFLGIVSLISRLDPLSYATVVNGLLYASLIYISGAMMNGFSFLSLWYKRILLSVIVLSPCLLEIYPMLWSETLFLIFSLLFILLLTEYFRSHSTRTLMWTAFIAALACVTRYAGVALIATGGLLIIIDAHLPSGRKLRDLSIFSGLGISLLVLNLMRNRMVSGFLTGARQKGTTPLLDNLYYYGVVLCDWLPITKNNRAIALTIALVTILLLMAFCIWFVLIRAYSHGYESVSASFFLLYAFFMILSATVSRYQELNSRLLAPLFIPFIWSISFWIPKWIKSLSHAGKVLVIAAALIFFLAFQYNQLAADYETYDGVKDAGVPGYTEDPFPQSHIVRFIIDNRSKFRAGYMIYSNAGDAVYFFTGLSANLLPEVVFPKEIQKYYAGNHQYLVWFNDIDNPDVLSLQEILSHKRLVPVIVFPDGAVYTTGD